MSRAFVIVLIAFPPASALGQPPTEQAPASPNLWQIPSELPAARSNRLEIPSWEGPELRSGARTVIAPNATFGIGMFGLKRTPSWHAPSTGSEVKANRGRRIGVGLSLKF